MAVLPSADNATEVPWWAFPSAPVPTSLLPCWLQTPPLWVKTQAAPTSELLPSLKLSSGPPTMAVLPSPESATEAPWLAFPTAPVPTSLLPCWVQRPPLGVKTQGAPVPELSSRPPTMAVLPSPDSPTDQPWLASPRASMPTSFDPCCVNCVSASCDEKRRPAKTRTAAPNNFGN